MITTFRDGLSQIGAGFARHHVWRALAIEDITDQHRRTLLGPAWILLNYVLFAATFIVLFQRGAGIANYVPYVAIGLFVWFIVADAIGQGVNAFVREEGFIKGTTLPLFVYVMRLEGTLIIRAVFTLIGCLIFLLSAGYYPELLWLEALLGLAFVLLTLPALITIFGIIGAYMPDMKFVVGNLVRIGLFLTPIFWVGGENGGIRNLIHDWNPFTYVLAIVRTPITVGSLDATAWLFCIVASLVTWLLAIYILGATHKKLVHVL